MANEKKIDNVILGLLSHEELTGYDIKQRMEVWMGYFWGASYGSIYPALNELAEKGYAECTVEDDGPRPKQRFRITDSGREKLKEWLDIPAEKDEVRYETLLKLFFGSDGGVLTARQHIERFRMKTERQLAQLLTAEQGLKNAPPEELEDDTHTYYLMTVRFGIHSYEAYLRWCDEAEAMLDALI